jgi:3-methyl-2-oxobutanoate hydroxymethyltransferase
MAGYLQESGAARAKPVTTHTLQAMRAKGDKISMLTCYDASFATLMERAGLETVLIGDSWAWSARADSTLPVTIRMWPIHGGSRARHPHHADHRRPALRHLPDPRGSLPQRRAAHAGGRADGQARRRRVAGRYHQVPHRARHSGVRAYRPHAAVGAPAGRLQVQGKTSDGATQLHADALAVQQAGASLVVIEAVPATLGKE